MFSAVIARALVPPVPTVKDSRERKILVERRPVQAERRDLDTTKIRLRSRLQSRVALDRKTNFMAAREPNEN